MKYKIKRIHFVGIGGVGMSGIAEVLHHLGYIISGSDINHSNTTNYLTTIGIMINIGHHACNIDFADVLVVSNAITDNNPEIIAAKQKNITIVPRAMMLAELMRFKYGIAIAGTHGKTTTTSLCAEVLRFCGLDPTFLIGGKLAVTDSNAKLGSGDYLIAEADESDASFLYLSPLIAVVTNIDLDHMVTYDHSEQKLKQTFIAFLHKLPFYGVAILCNEDARVRDIIPHVKRKIITYGLSAESDIYAINIVHIKHQMQFTVCIKENNSTKQFAVILNLIGIHNVLNALAVIAVGIECETDLLQIITALSQFHGAGRRCQHYANLTINNYSVDLIDDYGHHPNEIKATLTAIKSAYPQKKIILIFQPHRYSRTHDLFDDFVLVLSGAIDYLIILEVYAAGEEPIALADSLSLIKAIKITGIQNIKYIKELYDVYVSLALIINSNNYLIITMGAGNISKLPQILIESSNKI